MTMACPYCRTGFEAGSEAGSEAEDEIKVCDACATPHHADCYLENGGCTVFGCANAPVDEPKISVTPAEMRGTIPLVATAAPTGSTPPPPRMPGNSSAVAPPPRPFASPGSAANWTPAVRAISFGGYNPQPGAGMISPYIRRRSRLTFILLGVLLGPFGGHNFYAGYVKRAVIQLLITVLSCLFGGIVSWIWAICEVCLVTQDDDGIPFL